MRSPIVLASLALVVAGCTSKPKPTTITASSPAHTADARVRDRTGSPVVVVAPFENPAHASVAWKDLGSGMSAALERMLLRQTNLDVWIESGPRNGQSRRGRDSMPADVDVIIEGRLTDFYHTADLPMGLKDSSTPEAVVALDVRVVEPETGRVVAADHILGHAPAGSTPSKELYAGLDFGSYAFWSTPLGRASHDAIQQTVARLRNLVPKGDVGLRITSVHAREVELRGPLGDVRVGDELYVFVSEASDEDADPDVAPPETMLTDPDLHRPIRVRVTALGAGFATGWLLGRADERSLTGAAVRRAPSS